jgi:hypothetical protein
MHQHGGRNTRLQIRVIRRPSEAQAKQRQNVFWQLQQFGDAFNVITQAADVDTA